jgi:hypothetical protein
VLLKAYSVIESILHLTPNGSNFNNTLTHQFGVIAIIIMGSRRRIHGFGEGRRFAGKDFMLTLVEVIACRDTLRDANALVSQVRGAFLVAQYMHGARVANDILVLIADIIRSLDVIEKTITAGKP